MSNSISKNHKRLIMVQFKYEGKAYECTLLAWNNCSVILPDGRLLIVGGPLDGNTAPDIIENGIVEDLEGHRDKVARLVSEELVNKEVL